MSTQPPSSPGQGASQPLDIVGAAQQEDKLTAVPKPQATPAGPVQDLQWDTTPAATIPDPVQTANLDPNADTTPEEQIYTNKSPLQGKIDNWVAMAKDAGQKANTQMQSGFAMGETQQGIEEGGTSFVYSLSNLLSDISKEALGHIGSAISGESMEQLKANDPTFFGENHLELPDSLKTHDIYGTLVSGTTQAAAALTGLGAVTKLPAFEAAVGGTGELLQKAPLIGKIAAQLGSAVDSSPKLAQALELAKGLIKGKAADAVVSFAGWQGHQGNLANAIHDMLGGNPIAENAVIHALQVNPEDSDLFARSKNALTAEVGASFATPIIAATKLLKAFGKHVSTAGDVTVKDLKAAVKDVEAASQEALQATQKAGDEFGSILDSLHDPAERRRVFTGGFESNVEIFNPDMDVKDVAEKVLKKSNLEEYRAENLRESLRHALERANKKGSLDTQAMHKAIAAKLEAGEPVDFGQMMLDHTKGGNMYVKDFMQHWPEVLKMTVKEIKRVVPNAETVNRTISILGTELGLEAEFTESSAGAIEGLIRRGVTATSELEQALETRLGLAWWNKSIAPNLHLQLFHDLNTAYRVGDVEATSKLADEIETLRQSWQSATLLDKSILSGTGRLLQSAQIPIKLSEASRFTDQVGKKVFRLGVPNRRYTDAELKAGAAIAEDVMNNSGGSLVHAAQMHRTWMGALTHIFDATGKTVMGSVNELYYNFVLSSPHTAIGIAAANARRFAWEDTSSLVGATSEMNPKGMRDTAIRMEGFWRYFHEGMGAGLRTFATGKNEAFIHNQYHPAYITSENLRQIWGFAPHNGQKNMADHVIDAVGGVIRIGSTRMMEAADAPWRVAGGRSWIWQYLKSEAMDSHGMNWADASEYAATHINSVTHDLIMQRALDFNNKVPPQNTANWSMEQLQNINTLITNNVDFKTHRLSLAKAENPYFDPSARSNSKYSYSDRQLFQIGNHLNQVKNLTGIVGAEGAGFIRTFFNLLVTGLDENPLTSWMSPYNQRVWAGDMGDMARQNLKGKMFLGLGLMGGGIIANRAGMITTPGGPGANLENEKMTGSGFNTVKWNLGNGHSMALDLGRLSPEVEMSLLSGHLDQALINPASSPTYSTEAKLYAVVGAFANSYATGRTLYGFTHFMNNLANPDQTTGDAFRQSVMKAGIGPLITPAIGGFLRSQQDPYQRDFTNYPSLVDSANSYFQSRMPNYGHVMGVQGSTYDLFGTARPRKDYWGDTENIASDILGFTGLIGQRYAVRDPIALELERLGQQGFSLSPPTKIQQFHGVPIPLDQYKNSKGESLWDAYNRELAQQPSRQFLNELVGSEDYKKGMTDNSINYDTGKRNVLKGSRWTAICKEYTTAKEATTKILFNSPQYASDYRNPQGQSMTKKAEQSEQYH